MLPFTPTKMTNQPPSEGLRFDTDKLLFDCIPPYSEEMIARVLTMGAKKYSVRNWELGMDWDRCINSLMRHLNKFRQGVNMDEESGLPHIAHVAVNAIFLLEYSRTHPEKDTRRNSVAQHMPLVHDGSSQDGTTT